MEFQAFIEKQNSVYSEFKKAEEKVRTEGTVAHTLAGKGVYFIAFRFPDFVTKPIEAFNNRLSKEVPIMPYDESNLHATISDYNLSHNFTPDKSILKKLSSGIEKSIDVIGQPEINYGDWLFNQNTVIMPGKSNSRFLTLSREILNEIAKEGLELRMPWGAHMTTARFAEAKKPEELSGFFKLMKEAPRIGEVIPEAIDVGYAQFTKGSLDLTIYERFEFEWFKG